MNNPTAVASDGTGGAYVVESSTGRLLVYDASGRLRRAVGELPQPISIAVGPDGTVFVGSGTTGSVSALGADLQQTFLLGAGVGEFTRPTGIAVHSDGTLFVADQDAHQIKVYDSDGRRKYAFGSPGTGDGTLNFPLSVAVDGKTGELYVIDRLSTRGTLGDRMGSRIQVFSREGVFRRSFGEVGRESGMLARPIGVQTDHEGRVYVSDALRNTLQVFTAQGVYLGNVDDPEHPLRTPLGVAFDRGARRLLVASLNTHRVERFQLLGGGYRVAVVVQGEGRVEPPGPLTVEEGGSVDFRFEPAADCLLAEVTVDGAAVEVDGLSFTLDDVFSDRVVMARFQAEPPPVWTVDVVAGGGGSVAPSGAVVVEDGGALQLEITPATGNHWSELYLDGVAVTGFTGSVYTLQEVTTDHVVEIRFAASPDPGDGGPGTGGGTDDGNEEPTKDPVDGPVEDPVTGLSWAADPECGGSFSWQQALAFVADLNAGLVPGCGAGHSDWRLPNARELESLTRNRTGEEQGGWLTEQGLAPMTDGTFWSSTTYGGEPDRAWVLEVAEGALSTRAKLDRARVWPVRSTEGGEPTLWRTGQTRCYDVAGQVIPCPGTGQDGEWQAGRPWPSPRFSDNREGTTTDRTTGLTWLNDPDCLWTGPATAHAAVQSFNEDPSDYACAGYSGRYADWRLPTVAELGGRLDFSDHAASCLPGSSRQPLWVRTEGEADLRLWSPLPIRAADAGETSGRAWLVRDGTALPPEDDVPLADGSAGGDEGAGGGLCFLAVTEPPFRTGVLRRSAPWGRLFPEPERSEEEADSEPRCHAGDFEGTGGR